MIHAREGKKKTRTRGFFSLSLLWFPRPNCCSQGTPTATWTHARGKRGQVPTRILPSVHPSKSSRLRGKTAVDLTMKPPEDDRLLLPL